ncbi:MAG: hypothetical protein KIC51_00765 [Acetobacter sp.]|nr:hypothetical protein [Acetobacter sp.]
MGGRGRAGGGLLRGSGAPDGVRTAAPERKWALRRQAINDGAAVQCTGVSGRVCASGVVGKRTAASERKWALRRQAINDGAAAGDK